MESEANWQTRIMTASCKECLSLQTVLTRMADLTCVIAWKARFIKFRLRPTHLINKSPYLCSARPGCPIVLSSELSELNKSLCLGPPL